MSAVNRNVSTRTPMQCTNIRHHLADTRRYAEPATWPPGGAPLAPARVRKAADCQLARHPAAPPQLRRLTVPAPLAVGPLLHLLLEIQLPLILLPLPHLPVAMPHFAPGRPVRMCANKINNTTITDVLTMFPSGVQTSGIVK